MMCRKIVSIHSWHPSLVCTRRILYFVRYCVHRALWQTLKMSTVRDRTVVVDFSVLPERPKLDIVQRFVDKCIGLTSNDIKSIQLNNIRHCVLIAMADVASATNIATAHHLKHAFRINPAKRSRFPSTWTTTPSTFAYTISRRMFRISRSPKQCCSTEKY